MIMSGHVRSSGGSTRRIKRGGGGRGTKKINMYAQENTHKLTNDPRSDGISRLRLNGGDNDSDRKSIGCCGWPDFLADH